ncbi:MAG TPA: fructosamine kinase family protein [Kofleriaceae bacterium]|jgi:fructosamine-3-kinase|nr:fructosamine kinase family protein [Kofleriaceae bacterium]
MNWIPELAAALGARVEATERVAGGDINDAFRVRLADRRVVFVKTHAAPPAGMFAAEAAGLDWLRAGPLRIPRVLAASARWLALEWLALTPTLPARSLAALGHGLARLHRLGAPAFGFPADNFLATLLQRNVEAPAWPEFYVEQRLRPLAELGLARGRMPDLRGALDALAGQPDRFGPPEPPARLHGDLWWGNVAACDGEPVLIDPAVYGGHREIDLAMLALFGDLPEALIAAYGEVWPLAEGWQARLPLHQLYPLSAHAVLFGGGYGARVARVLATLR